MTSMLNIDGDAFRAAFGAHGTGVGHALVDHPLLSIDALASLADALPANAVERHKANLPKVLPGGEAPPVEGKPSETLRGLDTNGCWMVLWHIEQSPAYKALLDSCLDEVETFVGDREGGMRNRQGFIFLSAPKSVTPVHFDPEHNLLLEVRGTKYMNVCTWASPQDAEREFDRYYRGGHRNLDAMPADGETFELTPGHGVYVPSFAPHWVENGDNGICVALSITFRTIASERAEKVHALNARLRKVGLRTRPPGASPAKDKVKAAVQTQWGRLVNVTGRSRSRVKH